MIMATYVSENSFTVTGNQVEIFNIGRRVECVCSGIDKYGTITASNYIDPDTLVSLTTASDNLDIGLTEVKYGVQAGSIGSLPEHFHSSAEGDGGNITVSGTASTVLTSWIASGSLYYADFNHNLNTDDIAILLVDMATDQEIGVEETEVVSVNTVRIYITDNTSSIKINVISGGGYGTGYESFSPSHMVYVAKNGSDLTTDGSRDNPFLTIEAANDYAITLLNPVMDWNEAVVIKVAPGKYTEHFTDSHRRIYITGNTTDLENWRHDVIIYNTGMDPAHYIFDLTVGLNLVGLTVQVDDGGIFGTLPNKTLCSVCQFRGGGHWIQDLTILDLTAYFNYCVFAGDAFKFEGVSNAEIGIFFRNCDIYNGTNTVFSSSGTGAKKIKLENTKVGNPVTFAGEWSLLAQRDELYSDGTIIFDTDGYIDVSSSIIKNGIHFIKDTIEYKRFVGNYFRDITLGQTDITVASGTTISIVDYEGNKQDNGLPSAFQIAGGGRNVGGFAENRYCSLPCAIESIPAGESGTIEIYESQSALDEFILNAGSKVTIKCGKKFDLEFTGNIVTLGENQELNLHEVAFMSGQKMEVAGDGALLSFENCQTCQGYIVATSGAGSMVLSYFSSLQGVTGYPTIQIDNADVLIVSGYSRIKSPSGQPAVSFSLVTTDKLKAKFSTFIHVDGGANRPIVATYASGKSDVLLYNCAANAGLDTSDFNNIISSPNLTTSSEIDF